MSANTKWYITIPVNTYKVIEDYGVTYAEMCDKYPNACLIRHWSEVEEDISSEDDK